MKPIKQPDRETCRVIVFDQGRNHALVVADEAGLFFLPSVEVPCWERVAENLTQTVRSNWGCDAISLFTPGSPAPGICSEGSRYEVMECCCSGRGHARDTAWVPIRDLTRSTFRDHADHRALEQCRRESDDYSGNPRSPFVRSGWFTELQSWIAEIIRPMGLQLTETFHQFNASPSFSLIRFETSGLGVWFKAVGEPNLREFPITVKLARLLPEYVAEIIGTRPDWNGWLSLEASGTNLSDTQEITFWEGAAMALAKLQVKSVGEVGRILDSGARDLRANTLSALVDPFLDFIALLMEQQTKVPPSILKRQELDLLGVRIQDSLTLLDASGIPNALGHLDLNAGNIIVSPNECVFLDWAEAYVGHPFFSFEYLLEHFRNSIGADIALETRLVKSYSAPWEQIFSSELIAGALTLAPLAAAFAYAAGTDAWRDRERPRDPEVAGYFRSLARRMNCESMRFIDRRSLCLS